MFPILALLFIVVPIAELALLIQVGSIIHFWPTVALIFTTGVVGAWLARLQGRRVLDAIRTRLARGELPGDDLLDGLLILIAGVLLVTPGLLTDVTGLLLLVPPLRALARRRIKAWFMGRLAGGRFVVGTAGRGGWGPGWNQGDVIDVDPVQEPDPSERSAREPDHGALTRNGRDDRG